jgi:hypothetical protein
MIDPAVRDVAVSLVASGAYDVIKAEAKRWIDLRFAEHTAEVRATAEANKDAFLVDLAGRVKRLEDSTSGDTSLRERLAASFKDPDVSATLQSAVVAAARTSSAERHSVLADVIAARLSAPAGTTRAVASSFAVEIVPRLAAEHLEILGLLSVIYGPRPSNFRLSDDAPISEEEFESFAKAYAAWLSSALAPYKSIPLLEASYAHLVAASCIIFEQKVARELTPALLPAGTRYGTRGARMRHEFFEHEALHFNGWLDPLWTAGSLQHARPTPAGLLIGAAVHDAKVGSASLASVEWAEPHELVDNIVSNEVWDGQRIGRDFFRALEEEIRSYTDRGGRWP